MSAILNRRLRRFNGTDYDIVHLETDKTSITDFPETMPPSHHTHAATDITSGVLSVEEGGTGASNYGTAIQNLHAAAENHTHSEYAPVNHTHSQYAATNHTHTRNQIIDFPATMPPTAHTHPATDITGVVGIAKGGTGAGDAATARSNLGITPTNIGAAAMVHNHSISQITDMIQANTRSSLVLRTQDASGSPHSADNHLLYARYNAYGDGRFGIKVDGFESRVDFATNCVTPNGDTVSNWLNYLNGKTDGTIKIKSGSYVGQGDTSAGASFGPQISYGLTTTYAFFIHYFYPTSANSNGRYCMAMPYVMADAIDTSASPANYYILTTITGSIVFRIAIAKNYFYPVYYTNSSYLDSYSPGITYNWFAIGI